MVLATCLSFVGASVAHSQLTGLLVNRQRPFQPARPKPSTTVVEHRTCWKRRSRAGSFSMNFLNLSGEVAPAARDVVRARGWIRLWSEEMGVATG